MRQIPRLLNYLEGWERKRKDDENSLDLGKRVVIYEMEDICTMKSVHRRIVIISCMVINGGTRAQV
jgi:hypothetical protein